MAWDILNVEPAHGICDVCKQHTCGVVDGKHMWIRTGMYDRFDDEYVVGYNCVKLWSENLGISKQVVERVVAVRPSDEQIQDYLMDLLTNKPDPDTLPNDVKPRRRKVNERGGILDA